MDSITVSIGDSVAVGGELGEEEEEEVGDQCMIHPWLKPEKCCLCGVPDISFKMAAFLWL